MDSLDQNERQPLLTQAICSGDRNGLVAGRGRVCNSLPSQASWLRNTTVRYQAAIHSATEAMLAGLMTARATLGSQEIFFSVIIGGILPIIALVDSRLRL